MRIPPLTGAGRPLRRLAGYVERPPPPELTRWVELLWAFRSRPGWLAPPHRVLPNGSVSLCFTYRVDARGRLDHPALEIVAPVHRPRIFRPEAGLVMEAVQVRPEWAMGVLGLAPGEVVGELVPHRAVPLPGGPALESRALEAAAARGGATTVLLDWIRDRAARLVADAAAAVAHRALRHLRHASGSRHPIRGAAEAVGVSTRHLRRSVRAATGASPKFLGRVGRLNALVAEADATATPRWASLAARHGYYDQAHLIADVSSLTGLTPAALHRERRTEHLGFPGGPPSPR